MGFFLQFTVRYFLFINLNCLKGISANPEIVYHQIQIIRYECNHCHAPQATLTFKVELFHINNKMNLVDSSHNNFLQGAGTSFFSSILFHLGLLPGGISFPFHIDKLNCVHLHGITLCTMRISINILHISMVSQYVHYMSVKFPL